jgi:hypothetical protein
MKEFQEDKLFKVTVFANRKEVFYNVTLINPMADLRILVLVLRDGSSVVYSLSHVIKYKIEKQERERIPMFRVAVSKALKKILRMVLFLAITKPEAIYGKKRNKKLP